MKKEESGTPLSREVRLVTGEDVTEISRLYKVGMAAVERSDEETVVKACEGLKDIALARLKDLPNDPNYKPWEDYTPEEKNAKIDHIMGWLKPMIARLKKQQKY